MYKCSSCGRVSESVRPFGTRTKGLFLCPRDEAEECRRLGEERWDEIEKREASNPAGKPIAPPEDPSYRFDRKGRVVSDPANPPVGSGGWASSDIYPATSPRCYCGYLGWTEIKYGRVTHKHACPARTDEWCQTHPEGGCDPASRQDSA